MRKRTKMGVHLVSAQPLLETFLISRARGRQCAFMYSSPRYISIQQARTEEKSLVGANVVIWKSLAAEAYYILSRDRMHRLQLGSQPQVFRLC